MINWAGYAPLLDIRYWLNPRIIPLGPLLVGKFVFFLGWFVLAAVALLVAARLLRKSDKLKSQVVGRFGAVLLQAGLLGYLVLFLAYEQVPILGMRFWALVWLALFIYWTVRAVRFAVKEYPARAERLERLRAFRKYLPNSSR
jgi:hypothetical protein